MYARSRNNSQNGEIPLAGQGSDLPVPEGRIEMGPPPEIDIANDQLGTLFVERRRTLGLKVEEVAEDIKIKTEYLRAIEQEDFELLPTPEYARLFIRAYAERLGFNTTEVYALLDINMPGWNIAAKPKHTAPASSGGVLSGPLPGTTATAPPDTKRGLSGTRLLIGVAGAIVVLGIIAWIVIGMQDDDQAGSTDDAATTSQASMGASDIVPAQQPQPQVAADTIPAIATAPADWQTLHLVLHFDEETWASLQADGDNVANSIFVSGSKLEADGAQSFRLSLGHTVGVTATVNDQPLRPFRDWADRLEGHLITRDSIQAWLDTTSTGANAPSSSVESHPPEFVGPRKS